MALPADKNKDHNQDLATEGRDAMMATDWSSIYPTYLAKPNMSLLKEFAKTESKNLQSEMLPSNKFLCERNLKQFGLLVAAWRYDAFFSQTNVGMLTSDALNFKLIQ